MKKYFICFAALLLASVFAALSCTQIDPENAAPEENGPADQSKLVTITAYLPEDNPKSKISITEADDYSYAALTWQSVDKLTVIGESTKIFSIDQIMDGGKKATFTGEDPCGSSFTILYHPSNPADTDGFDAISYDGQVQNGNGSTAHLKYAMKLSNVDAYSPLSFTGAWAAEHHGTLTQNSVLQLILKLPDGVGEVYSIYVKDGGTFQQTLWLTDDANIFATTNDKHVIKGYMMVPDMSLTSPITVRVETEDGAYEADYALTVTNWTGGSQYTVQKNMSNLSAVTGEHAKMEIHAKSAQDILQFRAGNNAAKARFRSANVIFENDLDFSDAGTWDTTIDNQYKGLFDGNTKTVYGLNATSALFERINGGYTVKDFTVDESCTFTFENASDVKIGAIANFMQGTLSGVTVNANVTLRTYEASALVDLGGLVGRCNAAGAQITNCHFNGTITVPSDYSNTNSFRLGGIVGCVTEYDPAVKISSSSFGGVINCAGDVTSTAYSSPIMCVGGIVGLNAGQISECTTDDVDDNKKASVTISSKSYKASILVHPTNKYQAVAIGGIVGHNQAAGSLEDCNNHSTIVDIIPSGNAANVYLYAGGIVGQNNSSISGCKNYAKTIHVSTSRYQYLGGAIGYQVNGNVSDCSNETSGELISNGGCRYPRIGGLIGYNSALTISGTNSNKAPVSLNAMMGSTYGCEIGGVIGHSVQDVDGGNTQSITNSGDVTVTCDKVSTGNICIGGILGYSNAIVNGVKNGGEVHCVGYAEENDTNAKNSTQNAILGGILGYTDQAITISNSTNNAGVTYEKKVDKRQDSCPSFVGGVVGKMSAGGVISSCCNTAQALNQNFNNTKTLDGGPFSGGIVGAFVGSSENNTDQITGVTVEVQSGYIARGKRGYNAGIAGYVSNAEINGISCIGTVYGTNASALCAGAAGLMVNSILKNFTFSGNINNGATSTMAGLVYSMDNTSEINNCHFNGNLQYSGGAIVYTAPSGAKITDCGIKGKINNETITTADKTTVVGDTSATIAVTDISVQVDS